MKFIVSVLLTLEAVGSACWLGSTAARAETNSSATNIGSFYNYQKGSNWSFYITNAQWLTITNTFTEPFLTISNRPYVQFGGSFVVRVTDAEWQSITNR